MNGLGKKKMKTQRGKKAPEEASNPNPTDEQNTKEVKQDPKTKKKVEEEDPEVKKKAEEELKKQLMLQKQIDEIKKKLLFEQQQREKIIKVKTEEIKRKEQSIQQMQETNDQLAKELETLETQIQQNFERITFRTNIKSKRR